MDEKRKYELMLIIDADLTDAQREKALGHIKKIFDEHKCSVFHEEVIGVRDLAYDIKKSDKGYYVVMFFETESDDNAELEKELKLEKAVLRHLVSRVETGYKISKNETAAVANFNSLIEDYSEMSPSEYEEFMVKKEAQERTERDSKREAKK